MKRPKAWIFFPAIMVAAPIAYHIIRGTAMTVDDMVTLIVQLSAFVAGWFGGASDTNAKVVRDLDAILETADARTRK